MSRGQRILRAPGHALIRAGIAHGEDGAVIIGVSGVQTAGYARCACGEHSPVLPSREQRIRWHLLHREAIIGVPWA